jgi:serine/threonine protein kinase
MDWGKIAGDFANFQEKASAKLNEAADLAKVKIEEAKYRLQPPLVIGQHEVSIIKKLADGGFSEVFLAKSVHDPNEKFALKRMVCQNGPAKADAKAELKILKAFSAHPNIITVLGGTARTMVVPGQNYESMEVHFLFPFYEEGSAFDVMWKALEANRAGNGGGFGGSSGGGQRGFGSNNVWPFPEVELVRVLGGVASALIAMHKKGYAHRDIKVSFKSAKSVSWCVVQCLFVFTKLTNFLFLSYIYSHTISYWVLEVGF